nr:MAG TPA: hypothetical protein [Caudoviricetes sp.]DAS10660.1 MAG TPA: hypothetical protein [Caudoviricetes sp.]
MANKRRQFNTLDRAPRALHTPALFLFARMAAIHHS